MTMELRDMPPKNNPKGGIKTPPPTTFSEFERATKSNSSVFWRMVALVVISSNVAGFGTWIMWGMDSVKHSEIDQIMATRAPYMHDKERIEEKFSNLSKRDDELLSRLSELERDFKNSDAGITAKLQDLEMKYYRDHPNPK